MISRKAMITAVAGLLTITTLGFNADAKSVSAQTEKTNRCLQYMENGNIYIQTRRPDLAIAEYNKALELVPSLAVIESQIGYANLAKSDWAEAEKAFGRALEIDPGYGSALYGQALIWIQKKDADKAIGYLVRSVTAGGPAIAERYLQLGVLQLSKGNTEGAIGAWREGLKINPDNIQLLTNLGGLLAIQGKSDEGIVEIEKALKISPNFAQAHNNLGIALMQGKKDFTGAEKEFRIALKLTPNYGDAMQNLGSSLFLQKKYDDAAAAFNDIVKLAPNIAKPHYYLAAISSINNRTQDAIEQLGKAISLDGSLRKSAQTETSFDNIKNLEGFKKLLN